MAGRRRPGKLLTGQVAPGTVTALRGTLIAPQTQRQVTAALAGMTHVIFIAGPGSVLEANGFVACLGATWLTYVLLPPRRRPLVSQAALTAGGGGPRIGKRG